MGIVFEDDDGNEEFLEPYESRQDYPYAAMPSNRRVDVDATPKYAYFMEDLRFVKLFLDNVLTKNYPEEVKAKELLRGYTYFRDLLREIRQHTASVYNRQWKPDRRDFQHFMKHLRGILEIVDEAIKAYDRNDQKGIHYFIYHLLIFVL